MPLHSNASRRFEPSRPMGAGDFIWLAALGAAARRPATAEQVCACISAVAAGQWHPSDQLVCDCLDDMARIGHLVFDQQERFHITPGGRAALAMMLALPVDKLTSPMGQAGARLKLAFLDLADPEDQQRHVSDLISLCERELSERPNECAACSAQGCFGKMWADNQTEHLRRDLALLRRMADMIRNKANTLGNGCTGNGLHINCILN